MNTMEKGSAVFFFLTSILFISCFSLPAADTDVKPQNPYNFSAIFTFGDSTLDPGNNDGLKTVARANHLPYGREFNGGIPTGRFTNGKLAPDIVASHLGIKDSVPAYLDPKLTNNDLLTGVSFASAGSGLDDMTADITSVIHMSTQLTYFNECLTRILSTVGNSTAGDIMKNAVFTVGAATNDMLFNYYDLPTRRVQYSLSGYHDFLLKNLETFVTELYRKGARKILITGLPPIGCLPIQTVAIAIQHKCVDEQNEGSKAYNVKLQDYITRWETEFTGAKIVYADIYNSLMDMIQNPNKYGFEQTIKGCCGTGYIEMGPLCKSVTPICSDSSKYIFFDAIHPTEAGYQIIANDILSLLPRLAN